MGISEAWSRSLILCHRGLWAPKIAQNSTSSFTAAARNGFGIELDIRDFMGELVVSHDVPIGKPLFLKDVLEELLALNFNGHLALNVKSDGLVSLLRELEQLSEIRHFFFDMSVPEIRHYKSAEMQYAVRVSEIEEVSGARRTLGEKAIFWLDSFSNDWWIDLNWDEVFHNDETVFVVSPELHGRKPQDVWVKVAGWIHEGRNVGICTDYPAEFLDHKDERS